MRQRGGPGANVQNLLGRDADDVPEKKRELDRSFVQTRIDLPGIFAAALISNISRTNVVDGSSKKAHEVQARTRKVADVEILDSNASAKNFAPQLG